LTWLALAGNAGALQGLLFLLDCIQLQKHPAPWLYDNHIILDLDDFVSVPNFSTFGGAEEATPEAQGEQLGIRISLAGDRGIVTLSK
jgi:hypothetical protein